MPNLHSSTVITPGQLGPTKVQSLSDRYSLTIIISFVGIPSVIQIITLIPASAASITASAANAGGTKIKEVLAATSSTAYVKLNQTGSFASGSDLVAILAESSSYVMSTSTGSFASGSDFQASTTLGNAVGNIHRRTGSL